MKTLILMRHAQADPASGDMRDFDRPLTSKGKKDAGKIAEYIRDHFEKPGAIFSSSAKRTMETSTLLHHQTGAPLIAHEEFYHADTSTYLDFISRLSEDYQLVVITGHNPVISDLATHICKTDIEMKPSDFVAIRLKNNKWKEKPDKEAFFHKSVY
jgi:phosphohistidine phosphatase